MKLLTCSLFLLVIGISPGFAISLGKVVNKLSGKLQDVKKGQQLDNSIHQNFSHGFVPSQIKCKHAIVSHVAFINFFSSLCSQSHHFKSVIHAPRMPSAFRLFNAQRI